MISDIGNKNFLEKPFHPITSFIKKTQPKKIRLVIQADFFVKYSSTRL